MILIKVECLLFFPGVVEATTLQRSVACKTFQRFRIGNELNSFLVERECWK